MAVEVQTVIPVCTSDKRKLVRTLVIDCVIKGSLKMLHKRLCHRHIIVKRNDLVKDRHISGLTDVSACSCDEPKGIIVESGSDVGVALLGKGLILMVCTSVLELGGSDIDYPLTCAVGDKMYKSEQILTGISESHSASDTGFII